MRRYHEAEDEFEEKMVAVEADAQIFQEQEFENQVGRCRLTPGSPHVDPRLTPG